jgi:SulP family sulfate permease
MQNLLTRISHNWRSGITVALVSIPLSISLALAGGASPQMGIITAVWAGLAAAILGGSNYNIVGPTGALSGILASYSLLHGAETLPYLAILTGIIVLLIFVLKLERYIVLIPASVLHGFTLGVALTIGLGQLNSALGLKPQTVHETFLANQIESYRHIGQTMPLVALTFVVGLAFLLVASKYRPKFPWIVALSLFGIVLGLLGNKGVLDFVIPTIFSKYGSIPSSIIQIPELGLSHFTSGSLYSAAGAVAVVAILETLISGKIADTMTKTRFDQRPEIMGLGVANALSGIFGGIPATAALARTSLNVATGANDKISAFISSITIAIISLVFLSYFQYLPLAIVASILVYVAMRMVKFEHFHRLYLLDQRSFWLALIVAVLTVAWDPLFAIAAGTGMALLFFVDKLAIANSEVTVNDDEARLVARIPSTEISEVEVERSILVYRFSGELVYINAQAHLFALENVNGDTKAVVLSVRNLYYIDVDGMETLGEAVEILKEKHKPVYLSGVNQHILPLIEKTSWFAKLKKQGRIFDTTQEAIQEIQVNR